MNTNITALTSALVSTFLWALVVMAGYVISLGDIFMIDWRVMANIGTLSLLTGLVSLIKNYLTTQKGTVAGLKVVEK